MDFLNWQATELKDELDAATKDAKQKEEQIAQLLTVSEQFNVLENTHKELTLASESTHACVCCLATIFLQDITVNGPTIGISLHSVPTIARPCDMLIHECAQ